MIAAVNPPDEQQRIAELYALKVLDTPREERFDAIVRLARHLFRVPIAYIALIDTDRQWFKAQEGLNASQTGRAESFCGHAILQDGPTVVPDARLDLRFADNPMVLGDPYVRFYAGSPLRGPQGHKIGTLCLVDREPRSMTETDLFSLRQLGLLAEQQLQLTAAVAAQQRLIETQAELAQAQQHLTQELREAEAYVRSLLPPPIETGPVQARWEFLASSTLGGDLFGYHWLDADHFVMYLLDVCGHGVGASLLSSSVQSTLRRETLPATDFTRPAQVLSALDQAFPMHEHFDKFFTLWYGVYCLPTRTLRYAAAGHPPAILIAATPDQPQHPVSSRLELPALMIGVTTDRPDDEREIVVEPGSRLYVFSDGAFEAPHRDGSLLGLSRLEQILLQAPAEEGELAQGAPRHPAAIAAQIRLELGGLDFEDDFSLLEFCF